MKRTIGLCFVLATSVSLGAATAVALRLDGLEFEDDLGVPAGPAGPGNHAVLVAA